MNGINLFLSYCTFERNFARSDGMFTEYPSAGGALFLEETATTIVDQCYFLRNFVEGGRAGAIFATDSTVLNVFNTTLRMNYVTSSYNFKSSGGAIGITQRGEFLTQSFFFAHSLPYSFTHIIPQEVTLYNVTSHRIF